MCQCGAGAPARVPAAPLNRVNIPEVRIILCAPQSGGVPRSSQQIVLLITVFYFRCIQATLEIPGAPRQNDALKRQLVADENEVISRSVQ